MDFLAGELRCGDTSGIVQMGAKWRGRFGMADRESLRIDFEVENPARRGYRRVVREALVAADAELSWIPRAMLEELEVERRKKRNFLQPDGTVLSRWTGGVSLYAAGVWTVDEVVFGESSDVVQLGARTLEGLNLRLDRASNRLVDAGPAPVAALGGLSLTSAETLARR